MTLTILVFLPLVIGLLTALLPRGLGRWVVAAGSIAVLVSRPA